MKKIVPYIALYLFFIFQINTLYSQNNVREKTEDYIKSAAFMKNEMAVPPFFRMGETAYFEFDDLLANETNYYFRVLPFNHDWSPSKLRTIDFLSGMEDQPILNYENSFNTLQLYSHYKLTIPNPNFKILKSGNYILEIFDDQDNIVIRRKFILYENRVSVSAAVKRTRDIEMIDLKQNLAFTIHLGENQYQNPTQNIRVAIYQNGRWNVSRNNIKPKYTLGNDLVYKYNKETQFWGGNEYLNFDNSDIKSINNRIAQVNSETGIYSTFLYINQARKNNPYTYSPDINGSFQPRNIYGKNPAIEADYTWVYFRLNPVNSNQNIDYYVSGMFNNYELTEDNRMFYNIDTKLFEKALLIKQGFTNFNYTAVKNGKIDLKDAPGGNFAQTENKYQILIYYRGPTDLYDRVIGFAEVSSEGITY